MLYVSYISIKNKYTYKYRKYLLVIIAVNKIMLERVEYGRVEWSGHSLKWWDWLTQKK